MLGRVQLYGTGTAQVTKFIELEINISEGRTRLADMIYRLKEACSVFNEFEFRTVARTMGKNRNENRISLTFGILFQN